MRARSKPLLPLSPRRIRTAHCCLPENGDLGEGSPNPRSSSRSVTRRAPKLASAYNRRASRNPHRVFKGVLRCHGMEKRGLTSSCSFMVWIAASAAAWSAKVTKPKPRERPVPGSVMTMQSITWPNCEKASRSESELLWCDGDGTSGKMSARCRRRRGGGSCKDARSPREVTAVDLGAHSGCLVRVSGKRERRVGGGGKAAFGCIARPLHNAGAAFATPD